MLKFPELGALLLGGFSVMELLRVTRVSVNNQINKNHWFVKNHWTSELFLQSVIGTISRVKRYLFVSPQEAGES